MSETDMSALWGDATSKAQVDESKAAYFRASRYALFIHWGLYAVAGSVWLGKDHFEISEWMMYRQQIPAAEYAELAKKFNPVDFDAAKVVSFAKECGMKYIVITAKHHEGFAMFKSAHPFNVVDATPWKRDPMKELASECAKQGIGFGFYYSQYQDWAEINRWETKRRQPSFKEYFRNKCLPQIKELLTNYGPLSLIWFDTPGKMTASQSLEIVEMVKKFQPQALVNSRIGNGVGDYSTLGDNEIPAYRPAGLWECIDTTNNSWGFSNNDREFRSTHEILDHLITVAARGGNYMINVGPDSRGNIPEIPAFALKQAGLWVRKYAEKMLYGADSSVWPTARNWGESTRRGNKAYFMVKFEAWGTTLKDDGFPSAIRSVRWLGKNRLLKFRQTGGEIAIDLPARRSEKFYEVLEIECDEVIPESTFERIVVDEQLATRLEAFAAKTDRVKVERSFWGERFGEWIYQIRLCEWQPGAQASWELEVLTPGYYRVAIRYQNSDDANRVWSITGGGDAMAAWLREVRSIPDEAHPVGRYCTFPAGVMKFPAGKVTLTLRPQDETKECSTEIAEVILTPLA